MTQQVTEVFICYRRSDGTDFARKINTLLDGYEFDHGEGESRRLRVYFDQLAPGVSDWREHLKPALESAHALIVVASPGLRSDLGSESVVDEAYEEIRYWCENRATPPIVVDTDPNSGGKWVPPPIRERWPRLNRLASPSDSSDEEFLRRVIDTIKSSEIATVRDEVRRLSDLNGALEEGRKKQASLGRRLTALAGLLAIAMIGMTMIWKKAVERADAAERATDVLINALRSTDPDQSRDEATAVQNLLRTARNDVQEKIGDPVQKTRVLTAIAATLTGLKDSNTALQLLESVPTPLPDSLRDSDLFRYNLALGEAFLYSDDLEAAIAPLERAQSLIEQDIDVGIDADAKANLFLSLGDYHAWSEAGSPQQAELFYEEAKRIDVAVDPSRATRALRRLAYLYFYQGDIEAFSRVAEAAAAAAKGSTSALVQAETAYNLGAHAYEKEKLFQSAQHYENSLAAYREYYSAIQPDTQALDIANTLASLGRIEIELGRMQEAQKYLEEAVAVIRKSLGGSDQMLAVPLSNLGLSKMHSDPTGAASDFSEAVEIGGTKNARVVGQALVHMSELAMSKDELQEARELLGNARSTLSRASITSGWRFQILRGAESEHQLRVLEQARNTGLECSDEDMRTLAEELASLKVADTVLRARWANENYFLERLEERFALADSLSEWCR